MAYRTLLVLFILGAYSAALADFQLATSVSAMGGGLCSAAGGTSAQCSFSGIDYLLGGTLASPYSGVLSASAAYGHLSADMTAQSSLRHFGTSVASAGFRDELTIAGSGSGFIQYQLTVSRDFVTWFRGYDIDLTQGALTPNHFTTLNCCSSGDNTGTITYVSSLYPVTFGTPFQLALSSRAYVWLEPAETGHNYFDLTVSGISVYDGAMNPIGAPVSSRSGTVYATPEPAGLVLALTTVALAGLLARKRRSVPR